MAIVQYTELIHRSSSLTSKFKACRKEKLIGWKPPLTNWVKLNTNGVFKSSPGIASAGGVIRDEYSIWISGFAFHIGPGSSVLGKLWDVFQGTVLCWEKGFKQIFVEVDSRYVVDIIQRKKNSNQCSLLLG